MTHDRIIPGTEYDLLMNYKEIADKMPCVQITISRNNYEPYISFIGDSTTVEMIINRSLDEEYHKMVNNINILINKYYKDNHLLPQQGKITELEETNKQLVTKLTEKESDLSNVRGLNIDLKNQIRILSENNQSLVNENLKLKTQISDNRNWFQKIFW